MRVAAGCLLTVILGTAVSVVHADTLRMRDGSKVEGVLTSCDSREARFVGPDGLVKTYPLTSVAGIDFEAIGAPAVAVITLPLGTPVFVRMIDSIDSTKSVAEDRFRASIDEPVIFGTQVVIPKGAAATVQIVENKDSKELSLKLADITLSGKSVEVTTEVAMVETPKKGGKSAKRAVGLGLLGATVGGFAGGGRGAAIGGAVGATAGVVSVAATGNKIQIKSETRMSFLLKEPLTIN